MTAKLDETFAAALRAALIERVAATPVHRARRRGRRLAAGTLAVLTAAGGGTALATTLLSPPPGGDVVAPLAPALTVTATGSRTVELGRRPAAANSIELRLTCLTAGRFTFTDGASVVCTARDLGTRSAVTTYRLPLAAGQHSTTITTTPDSRWRLLARYTHVATSPWGVNADGQTYGVANSHGSPDLIAVRADNGRIGYVYATQLSQAEGGSATSPAQAAATSHPAAMTIPVYQSDGHTRIGQFTVGGGNTTTK